MSREQLHSRGMFWRIRGGPPRGAAAGAGAPAAVELGNSWLRGADNPHFIFWRILISYFGGFACGRKPVRTRVQMHTHTLTCVRVNAHIQSSICPLLHLHTHAPSLAGMPGIADRQGS